MCVHIIHKPHGVFGDFTSVRVGNPNSVYDSDRSTELPIKVIYVMLLVLDNLYLC